MGVDESIGILRGPCGPYVSLWVLYGHYTSLLVLMVPYVSLFILINPNGSF